MKDSLIQYKYFLTCCKKTNKKNPLKINVAGVAVVIGAGLMLLRRCHDDKKDNAEIKPLEVMVLGFLYKIKVYSFYRVIYV